MEEGQNFVIERLYISTIPKLDVSFSPYDCSMVSKTLDCWWWKIVISHFLIVGNNTCTSEGFVYRILRVTPTLWRGGLNIFLRWQPHGGHQSIEENTKVPIWSRQASLASNISVLFVQRRFDNDCTVTSAFALLAMALEVLVCSPVVFQHVCWLTFVWQYLTLCHCVLIGYSPRHSSSELSSRWRWKNCPVRLWFDAIFARWQGCTRYRIYTVYPAHCITVILWIFLTA